LNTHTETYKSSDFVNTHTHTHTHMPDLQRSITDIIKPVIAAVYGTVSCQ